MVSDAGFRGVYRERADILLIKAKRRVELAEQDSMVLGRKTAKSLPERFDFGRSFANIGDQRRYFGCHLQAAQDRLAVRVQPIVFERVT